MGPKIVISFDRTEERASRERAARLLRKERPLDLSTTERAIFFLRAVNSRATLALPAFYLFHGIRGDNAKACSIPGYPGVVLRHALKFSSLSTVSLACRKIFDHGSKGLTGRTFAKCGDQTLLEVAAHWSTKSNRTLEEARQALEFLRSVFHAYARTDSDLLRATGTLGHRVAFLKQHADRSAAHLSMESYEIAIADIAHVVGTLTLIGEIVRSFDNSHEKSNYFDSLDMAAVHAAKQMFPTMMDVRLFEKLDIASHARDCWKLERSLGRQLLENLPYAMEWY